MEGLSNIDTFRTAREGGARTVPSSDGSTTVVDPLVEHPSEGALGFDRPVLGGITKLHWPVIDQQLLGCQRDTLNESARHCGTNVRRSRG